MTRRRRVPAVLLPAVAAAALGGCAILQILLLPLKLLFSAVEAVGTGIGGLIACDVAVDPIDGPAPTVTPAGGGRWLVEAPDPAARFRVTVSAEGRETRTFTWPDDFAGARPGADGLTRVDCPLAAVADAR